MQVYLIDWPGEKAWIGVKRRALITMYGWQKAKEPKAPSSEWKHRILEARHSPIRCLSYGFVIEGVPSNVATHLCRHVHAQPYVQSLRNDRQDKIDGDAAPRNTPVDMILDVNAEELMVLANKRLCRKASDATRAVVQEMCNLAMAATPELKKLLVPMCEYHGGVCHEMAPCGKEGA